MDKKNGGHLSTGSKAASLPKEPNPGPVPMHRRHKMGVIGEALQNNPFGTGAVPKTNLVANGQKKTW